MKITKGTIMRAIMLLLVIINVILKSAGKSIINVDEGTIGYWIEIVIEIAIVVVGFWKNNSFSEKAIKADEFLKELNESEDK